jgi:hypothetical protein
VHLRPAKNNIELEHANPGVRVGRKQEFIKKEPQTSVLFHPRLLLAVKQVFTMTFDPRNRKILLLVLLNNLCRRASPWVLVPAASRSLSESSIFVSSSRRVKANTVAPFVLRATSEDDDVDADISSAPKKKRRKRGKKPASPENEEDKEARKQELVKAVGEKMRNGISKIEEKDSNILDRLNPFKAGQNLRNTIDTALASISIPEETKSVYYMDDLFSSLAEGDIMNRLDTPDDYIPEVLVVGATGGVGRLVVKRLLLEGRFRVRVLVNDLYTNTLNMLGTGVTYCQGDLSNIDSLEYAVTDVDKIIFCSNPPRPDEAQFQEKFKEFMKENLSLDDTKGDHSSPKLEIAANVKNVDWEQLDSVLQVRAQLAEQVDLIGLKNLLQAFQNVRHADYGTSQAAKRSLFKFQSRPEDFNLFSLEEEESESYLGTTGEGSLGTAGEGSLADDESYDDDDDDFEDYYDDDDDDEDEDEYSGSEIEARRDSSVKIQTQWIKNQFGHGVFVGRVPQATAGSGGGEAAVTSSRLRSRQDASNGIDLGTGFAGFITRVCSDGGTYEAFVRTREYYENGIEYVCQFSTATKLREGKNKSRNKFVTVRLPFESFKPVQRETTDLLDVGSVPAFRGNDVRNIGFRYSSASNVLKSKLEQGEWSSFYLALSYIKLYRTQPEPEIVYLSDAQIPPVVRNGMVRHDARQLITAGGTDGEGAVTLLDESTLRTGTGHRSSPEETYYKYRGEELIKGSGLNYAIARVSGFNEVLTAETSTIDIRPSNEEVSALSRAEIAQVCVSALMDPNALNKSFYVTKKEGAAPTADESDYMRDKFRVLPADVVA